MAQLSERADVVKALQAKVDEVGGVRVLAPQFGVSAAYLYLVLGGHKEPGAAILEPLGFIKVNAYRKVSP